MTQKEQLVELLDKSGWPVKEFPNAGLDDFVQKLNDWLADRLLAGGVIVPPCKVGDTVYLNLCNGETRIEKVDCMYNYDGRNFHFMTDKISSFDGDAIGKYVFFTKDQAEQALKERSDG